MVQSFGHDEHVQCTTGHNEIMSENDRKIKQKPTHGTEKM